MTVDQIEKYAEKNNVPIIQKEAIEFIKTFIKEKEIKNILEIGSAIGYSAIQMAKVSIDVNVVTIERDTERFYLALKNIEYNKLEKQITIHRRDALEFETEEEFDLIFIDGAKGKYTSFFLLFENNLKKNGYIITDNLNFHGLINMKREEMTKNQYNIANKINSYKHFLIENKNYETNFYDYGDGLAISKRR